MFARKHMLYPLDRKLGCPSDPQYPTGTRCLRNPVVSSQDHPLPRKMTTNSLAFPSTRIRRMYFRATTYRCSVSLHGCAHLGRQGRPPFVLVTRRTYLDGRQGRWPGNVFVERLWHSLKQEEVYQRAYETVAQARMRIADYLRYFNEERPHQGLDSRTPTTYSTQRYT